MESSMRQEFCRAILNRAIHSLPWSPDRCVSDRDLQWRRDIDRALEVLTEAKQACVAVEGKDS